MIEFSPLHRLSVHLDRLIRGRLWLKVIIGLLLGALAGIILNPKTGFVGEKFSLWIGNWLDLPGQVFMKLVQMIMIPLIFTSIISGIVSNSSDNLKKLGLRLLIYFIFTTLISISIGAVLTLIMKPGEVIYNLGGFPHSGEEPVVTDKQTAFFDNIPHAISNLIPHNPLEAILLGEMLGVVIFTIIIGIAITQLKEDFMKPVIRILEAIQKICMIIVSWAMLIVPYAVFGLVAALLSRIGVEVFLGLGIYMGVVLLGLLILLIFYALVVLFIGGRNPLKFLAGIRAPQLLAFSTASSAAVMPLSMKVADTKLDISKNISDLIIPVGASINMDGTALFQCATTIFMAQAYGIDLDFASITLITATVVAASIGTPAIPGGGVIILASILQNAGIPVDGLIVIIGIDRILGMFRTAVNVSGDLTACVVFNRFYGSNRQHPVGVDTT